MVPRAASQPQGGELRGAELAGPRRRARFGEARWPMAKLAPLSFAGLALGLLGVVSRVEASPQNVLGFGARAMGMASTGAASAEGPDAVYGNPALLSANRVTQLQLGFEGAVFSLRADGPAVRGQVPASPFRATTIGAVLPLPFGGGLRDRLTLGLGFVTPTDVVVRARILYPERVQFPVADRVQSVAVQVGVGLALGHGFRLGGGVAALAALRGSVVVQTDSSGRVGTQVEDTLVASYAPSAGLSWESASGRYRVGVAFRGALIGRFNVVIRAENLGSLTIPPLNISGVAQFDPSQVAWEAARIEGPWRAALGATYAHWVAYPGPAEATVRCSDAAPPAAECSAPLPTPPGYRSVVTPRLGVERRVELASATVMALRAGYAFEPTPVPEQVGRGNAFDMHRSVVTAGFGVVFGRLPLGIDGFAQVHFLHPRDHRKHVVDGAPVDGTLTTSGHVLAGGIAVTARL